MSPNLLYYQTSATILPALGIALAFTVRAYGSRATKRSLLLSSAALFASLSALASLVVGEVAALSVLVQGQVFRGARELVLQAWLWNGGISVAILLGEMRAAFVQDTHGFGKGKRIAAGVLTISLAAVTLLLNYLRAVD